MRGSVLLSVSFIFLVGISTGSADESVQLIRYDGHSVNTSTPGFCWYSFNDAAEYRIDIADNVDFGCSFAAFVNDTCFTYDMELDEGMWYWRVSASEYYLSESLVDSVLVSTTGISQACSRIHIRTNAFREQSYLPNGRCFPENKPNRTQAAGVIVRGSGKKTGSVVSYKQKERSAE